MTPINTERLLLEPLLPSHAAEMFPVLSDPAIYEWLDYGAPTSVETLRALYVRLEAGHSSDGSEVWLNCLVRLQGGQAIGYVQATVYPGQRTYVGYVLASAYWGEGYATEAMTALMAILAREHPEPLTLAVIEVENVRSAALLRRLDFSAAPAGHSSATGLTSTERLYVRYSDEIAARRGGTSAAGYTSRAVVGGPVISEFHLKFLDELVVMWRQSFSAVAFGFEPTWKLDDVRYEWRRRTELSV